MKALLKSKYAKASMLYVILSILPKAINFLLLPLYLEYISPEEYGLLVLINLYGGLFGVFGCLQLNISASTQYFSKNVNKEVYRNGIIITTIGTTVLTFALFCAFGNTFFSFYNTEINFYPLGIVALISAALTQWNTILFVFLKNEYLLKQLGFFSLALSILGIGFQTYLIVHLKMGISGVVFGNLAAILTILPFMLIFYRKWFYKGLSDKKSLLQYGLTALKFSIPFLPTVFLNWAQNFGDRLIIENFMSVERVGQYAILLTLLTFPSMIVNAVMNALRPKLLVALTNQENNYIDKVEYLFTSFIVLILTFSLLGGTHLHWITDNTKYLEIRKYLFSGVLAILPGSLLYMNHLRLMSQEKTGLISQFSLFAVITQVIFLFVLVPFFGINGALCALGCGGILNYVLNTLRTSSSAKGSFKLILPTLALIIPVIVGLVLLYFNQSDVVVTAEVISVLVIILLAFLLRKEHQSSLILSTKIT